MGSPILSGSSPAGGNHDIPHLFKMAHSGAELKNMIYAAANTPETGKAFREAFHRFASDHALLFNDSTLFKEIRDEVRHIDVITSNESLNDDAGMSSESSTVSRLGDRVLHGMAKDFEEMIIHKQYDQLSEHFKGQGADFTRGEDFRLLLDYAQAGLLDRDFVLIILDKFSQHPSQDDIIRVLSEAGVDLSPMKTFAQTDQMQPMLRYLNPSDINALQAALGKTASASVFDQERIARLNDGHCPLRDLGLSRDELLQFFQNNGEKIKYFDASGFDIDLILELMKYCPNLSQVLLKECKISDDFAQALAEKLSQMKDLKTLDVSNNYIGSKGAQALGLDTIEPDGSVVSPLGNLQTLDVSNNHIGDAGAEALRWLEHLQTLDVSNNRIGAAGAEALGQLVNLQTLNVGSNYIGFVGAEALGQLEHLQNLNIAGNQIGPAGAEALSQLVNLQKLFVFDNQIGDAGAIALSQLVHLQVLDVGFNQIDDVGAQALSQLVNLQTLYVNDNRIGDAGAQALSQLVNLLTLFVGGNQIDENILETLRENLPFTRIYG